ncbi:hypothetical protein [Pendulispora albinea]|uniref:Uncharacterized protein n=1 Tax=Pendulispora albinea TaxID=2741071 RepID=A0ABZ2MB88_9BACT
MKKNIKALKDANYRREQGLDSAEHPAGNIDLGDSELNAVNGGGTPATAAIMASIRFCAAAGRGAGAALGSAASGCHKKAWNGAKKAWKRVKGWF